MDGRPSTEPEADEYAREWIAAWNSHDVDRVAAHYADTVEYESPFVARLSPGRTRLSGIDAVRDYIERAFERFPDLRFTGPSLVALGAGSVVIVYRSVAGLVAAETLVLDERGRVSRAHCHYRAAPGGAADGFAQTG
jgi:ketosteroid isomerase-like protein